MIELIDRRDLDDPGTAATSKIELIDRQDLDDPGTRTTLAAVDLIVRQDPSVHVPPIIDTQTIQRPGRQQG